MPTQPAAPMRSSSDLGAQIRDGVHDATDAISHRVKDAADGGKQLYDAGHERLREDIELLKSALAKLAERAVHQGETSVNVVTDAVASRPLLSVCGAFAAGLVVSFLLGDRRSS